MKTSPSHGKNLELILYKILGENRIQEDHEKIEPSMGGGGIDDQTPSHPTTPPETLIKRRKENKEERNRGIIIIITLSTANDTSNVARKLLPPRQTPSLNHRVSNH